MLAHWMEKSLVLTPESYGDELTLDMLATACSPRNRRDAAAVTDRSAVQAAQGGSGSGGTVQSGS